MVAFGLLHCDSWKTWIPSESEILSAIARTSSVLAILIFGLIVPPRPAIIARLVVTADVAPKLYLPRLAIAKKKGNA